MKKSIPSVLMLMSSLVLVHISAASDLDIPGQKAGLWEIKPIKQTMDGKDMLAQFQAAQEHMRQSMAKMTPDQRAKMEAMIGGNGFNASGTMKVCVSAAMAAKNQPTTDQESKCQPPKVSHSGNQTTYDINCTKDGRTTVGSGVSVTNGDVVSTDMNVKITDAHGQHTMQTQSQLTYLGADCQGVIPADQLMKNLKAVPH